MMGEPHLTSEEVAAYVDEALSEADSARIRSHLASCEECRSEVQSVSRLLEGAPRARRRFVYVPALAAAAVVAVLIGRAATDGDAPERLRTRTTPAAHEGVSAVEGLAPIGRQNIGDRIVFVWRPPLAGATYRLTLTDQRGGKIWTGSTNDTTITLPDAAVLRENQTYHWFVDALLPDGTDATTGVTSFRAVR